MSINNQTNAFIAVKNYLSECEAKADEVVVAMRRDAGGKLDDAMVKAIYAAFLRGALANLMEKLT